ncbi:MAG: ribose ABC transporter permease, partial [Spirochaetia bacterium]|nr:ribose ABC transporter permease [Spirochaetia bacterium]
MKMLSRSGLSMFMSRYGSFGVLFVISLAMSLANKSFLTLPNLVNVARQVSINTIISAGMTFIIITAGIDLSVGSLVALSSCVAMIIIEATGSSLLGICTGILIGGAAGAFNGAFVAWAGIPPFIVTLAGLTIYRGIALIITGGTPIIRFEGGFRALGQGALLGIPVPVIIMLIVVLFMHFLL